MRGRTFLATVVAVALVAASLILTVPAAAATTSPASWCEGQSQLKLAPALTSDLDRDPNAKPIGISAGPGDLYVPVVVVHGIWGTDVHENSRGGAFSKKIDLTANQSGTVQARTSLIGQLQDLPGSAVFTFDYSSVNTDWVTNPKIAIALGKAIDCLAAASGQKVIVVAHSMGGLATRLAITPKAGQSRSSEVSQVVTIGTPETGSWVASAIGNSVMGASAIDGVSSQQVGMLQVIDSACRADKSKVSGAAVPLCLITSKLSSGVTPGTTGLAVGSTAMRGLPAWPSGLPVHALAGDITIQESNGGWFRFGNSNKVTSVGDGLVLKNSALAGAGTSDTVTCKYSLLTDQVGDSVIAKVQLLATNDKAVSFVDGVRGPCVHTNLMRSIEMTNAALGYVADDLSARIAGALHSAIQTITAPAMCTHPGGELVDGSLLLDQTKYQDQFTQLGSSSGMKEQAVLGDTRSGAPGQIAVAFNCSAGGVGWPQVIGFYDVSLNLDPPIRSEI